MTVCERALSYTLAMPPSIGGQGGHDAAFAVACAIVHGFGLPEAEALGVLRLWNERNASPPWSERELAHKVRSALASASQRPRDYLLHSDRPGPATASGAGGSAVSENAGVAPKPLPPPAPRIPPFEIEKLRAFAEGCRVEITPAWLRERSPVKLPPEKDLAGTQRLFLESVFRPGEMVLIFVKYYSQGCYAWRVGEGGARLGDSPASIPVPSALPTSAREGLWFLSNPIDGALRLLLT